LGGVLKRGHPRFPDEDTILRNAASQSGTGGRVHSEGTQVTVVHSNDSRPEVHGSINLFSVVGFGDATQTKFIPEGEKFLELPVTEQGTDEQYC
jgi:hypothetical protein